MVGEGLATLHELQTVYDSEDLMNLFEIAQVRAYNRVRDDQ